MNDEAHYRFMQVFTPKTPKDYENLHTLAWQELMGAGVTLGLVGKNKTSEMSDGEAQRSTLLALVMIEAIRR